MRRGARWALGVGAALIAMMAVGGVRADVHSIDVDECSTSCVSPTHDEAAAAEDESAAATLSLLGGKRSEDGNNVRPDLIFDKAALPPVLVSGPPSPISSAGAQAFDSPGVSPYAFFEDIIDIPLFVDTRSGIAAAALSLFTPSSIGQLTVTDVLSNGNDLFKPLPPLPPHPDLDPEL